MNRILTIGGKPFVGPNGQLFQENLAGALNSETFGEVKYYNNGDQLAYFTIDQTEEVSADVDELKLTVYGTIDERRVAIPYTIPSALLTDLKNNIGEITIGTVDLVLGNNANMVVTGAQLTPVNETGAGYAPRSEFNSDATPVFTILTVPQITGTVTEFETMALVQSTYTNEPVDLVRIRVFQVAEDASGTNAELVVVVDDKAPEIVAGKDFIRYGDSYSSTAIPDGPLISWSDWEQIEEAVEQVVVALNQPPLVAINKLNYKSATAVGFDAREVLTGSTSGATAVIVDFESATSTTGTIYLGAITGTFQDNEAITCPGGSALANGVSSGYTHVEGSRYHIAPATYFGTPTSEQIVISISPTSSDGDADVVQLTNNQLPVTSGGKGFKYTHIATGYGVTGALSTSTSWIDIDDILLAPLADDDWPTIIVSLESTNVDRLEEVYLKTSIGADQLYWTTATPSFLQANPFPIGRSELVLLGTTTVLGVSYQRWGFQSAISGTPPKDFILFDRTLEEDNNRRVRLALQAVIDENVTPVSNTKTVPNAPATSTRSHLKAILRNEGQQQIGEPGGVGMQFPRVFDSDGDKVIMAFDVTWPEISYDFGDNWESAKCAGLAACQTYNGALVFGNTMLVHVGAMDLNTTGNYGDLEGIYRSTNNGASWSRVMALSNVYGSNNPPMRVNCHYMAKVPGATEATKTIWAVHQPCAFNANKAGFGSIQLMKADANGGASFVNVGSALPKSTYGIAVWLEASSNAIYLATQNGGTAGTSGVWRSPQGTVSWTKATGLPDSDVLRVFVRGSTVFAVVKGQGLYSAADATTLAFTRIKQFNAVYADISPANTNRRLLVGAAQVVPQGTFNGSTWQNVSSAKYPGQLNDFEHQIWREQCWVIFHDTDPNKILAMRFHHTGKCIVDTEAGGYNFYWSSRNFDCNFVRSFGWHPTDYRKFTPTMTDRLVTCTNSALLFVTDDDSQSSSPGNPSVLEQVDDIVPGIGGNYSCAGAVTLTRGGREGHIAQIGKQAQRTPVIASLTKTTTATGTGNGTITTTLSTSPPPPAGSYVFTCTTTATNGGTFTGVGPLGVPLGTFTVGTQRTYTHSQGGSITVLISDGSTDFGLNKKFTVYVNPVGSHTVLGPTIRHASNFGQTNPAVSYRGCSGGHCFEMATDGTITIKHSFAYDFAGYGGTTGNIIYASSPDISNQNIYRSTSEGNGNWSAWYTPSGSGLGTNFRGAGGIPCITPSSHNENIVYIGVRSGLVRKITSGVATTAFNLQTWLEDNDPGQTFGGHFRVGTTDVYIPTIVSVCESAYNPNLVYVLVFASGLRNVVFKTTNALSATPTWTDITLDGLVGPCQGMFIHPITDELFITSRHGNTVYKPDASHRTTYGITNSVFDDILADRGDDFAYIGV